MNDFIKSKRFLSIKEYNNEFGDIIEEKDYKEARVITYDRGLYILDLGDYFLLELNRSIYKDTNIEKLEGLLYSFYLEEIN